MNVKKLISSVSAMAIAASAFAGLAVSANAADDYFTQDYEADGATVDWASPNAEGALSVAEDNGNHYLQFKNSASTNSRNAYIDLSSATDSTEYVLEFDAMVSPGTNQTSQLAVYASGSRPGNNATTSNAIVYLNATAANGTSWTVNGGQAVTLANSLSAATWYHFIVAVDDDLTYLTINDANGSEVLAQTMLSTGAKLGGINALGGRYYWNYGFDNIVVRELTKADLPEVPLTPAGGLTIKYVAGDTVIYSDTADVSAYVAGQDYSYNVPAYYKSGDKYYKLTQSSFKKTVTLSADAIVDEVAYEAADAVVDYAEVNASSRDGGHGAFASGAANEIASGGFDGGTVYGQAGSNCVQAFNVPVNGKYNITVNAVGTASGNRSCYLTVDSKETDDSLGTLSCNNGATATQTVEVTLTAGDHNFYYLSNGSISPRLDYMVVELVSEAVVEPTKYTITLDYGDGTDPVPTEVEANSTFTFPTQDDRPGAEFGGWKLVKLGGDEVIVNGGEIITVTGDATYIAVWNDVVAPVVDPDIKVEKIGVFTEDEDSNPAAAFKGEVKAGTYAIEGLYWGVYNGKQYVYPANKDDYKVNVTVAADSTVVLGLVVEAATVDVNNINADLFVAG